MLGTGNAADGAAPATGATARVPMPASAAGSGGGSGGVSGAGGVEAAAHAGGGAVLAPSSAPVPGTAAVGSVGGPGAETPEPLTGPQKALLFLLSLDEHVAERVVADLKEREIRILRKASETMRRTSAATLRAVHREFTELARAGLPPSLEGSTDYLRKLTARALGEARAKELFSDRRAGTARSVQLDKLDADTLIGFVEEEPAQTVAVILSQIAPQTAADLLGRMSADRRLAVVERLVKLDAVSDDVVRAIESLLAEEAADTNGSARREVNGLEVAAAVVKKLDPELVPTLLADLGDSDPAAVAKIKKALFTFEDLTRIDNKGMQVLLKAVSTDQLVVALKTASTALREKVFSALSSRAAQMLREELEILGAVRIADVEAAQQAIVEAALRLEQEGRLQIAREGGDEYV
jgi:flagellar motor switch protein FliG